MKISDALKDKIWKWEDKNLINYDGYAIRPSKGTKVQSIRDNMQTRGYDAARVSPQTTNKNGMLYRAVYGAIIAPDYRYRNAAGKYTPKVDWTLQGYARNKPGMATGTIVFGGISTMHGGLYDKDILASKLMVKPAKKKAPAKKKTTRKR
jgi:hypothetical protein